MITIYRDNENVKIDFETDLPFDCKGTSTATFIFTAAMPKPSIAQMATEYFRNLLKQEMIRIRRGAYERGWKDAKAKRKKQDRFDGWL